MLKQAKQLSWAIATRQNPDFFQTRHQAHLLLQGSRATQDPAVTYYINEIFQDDLLRIGLKDSSNLNRFVNQAHHWIKQHQTNSLQGLDQYQRDYSAGTTQSFDSFYYRHRQRRMRCFSGEYFYHLKTWISTNTNWSVVTDSDPLRSGDALVISLPFCDTGNNFDGFESILELCDQLDIPVLVDCCYYTISGGITADLSYECIDTIAFSLSKSFPVANLRIGLRYTKSGVCDGQQLMNSINYNNSLSAYIGLKIIDKFGCDYIYTTYQQRQKVACDYFGLEPSQSVIFAVGNSQWECYNRNNLLQVYQLDLDPKQFCNRISLVGIFDNWDLFETIKNEY